MARLMRPGARGGWVNGSLDWSGSTRGRSGMAATARTTSRCSGSCTRSSGRGRSGSRYMYGYSNDRSIDLSAFETQQLWPLLDKAARLGLPLIHANASLGELPRPEAGTLVLDVTREGPDRFGMDVILRVGGGPVERLVPVRFIGSPAHGVVCAERSDVDHGLDADRWRIRLVRLERPAVAQLERMLLDGERIAIPAAELDRFASELCPALRHIAPVVSSDGSFTPPTVSAPSLVSAPSTVQKRSSLSVGSGNTRSATQCTGYPSTTRATPPGFATTPPSGRSLPSPCLTSPGSTVFRCSISPAVRRVARR